MFRPPLAEMGISLQVEDLYADENLQCEDFWSWAQDFNRRVSLLPGPHAIMGYSLGGRLALHALLSAQNLWTGGVIVSAHPGLSDDAEKKLRWENDHLWAERFLVEKWSDVLRDWNAQAVFAGRTLEFLRTESLSQRSGLARMMTTWSLAKQEDLRSLLSTTQIPLVWIVGKDDKKFAKLGEEIASLSKVVQLMVVPGSGHRVPWENKVDFLEALRSSSFLTSD